jgi:hypothetical protein
MAANTLVASAARTATGNSGAIALGSGAASLELELEVTAASGTSPSMTLSIQWSVDGTNFGNNDASTDAFAAVTTTGNVTKTITVRAPYMQLVWTITGTTPSFTFSVLDVAGNVL